MSYAATGGEMPRIVDNHQELQEAKKESTLKSPKDALTCPNLDFHLLSSADVRECISAVLSHPVCGI